MPAIFLHGGGDHPDKRHSALIPFLMAANVKSGGRIALIVAEEEDEVQQSFVDYKAIFDGLSVPNDQLIPIFVTSETPLTRVNLEDIAPSGVFVCGGATPFYQASLCVNTDWVNYLLEKEISYGGTSAGAAIAAKHAIVGGWQADRSGTTRDILFIGASEGLDPLTIRPGLGLVPFAVDVHASQMGTLTRLIHAVELGLVPEGWAIDENTTLEVFGGEYKVYGAGHAYWVKRVDDQTNISIYTASS